MNTHTEDRTFAQAAFAIGVSPSRFSHDMKAKGFRGRKGHGNARLINREELLRHGGRTVSDAAWDACRTVTAKPGKTEQLRRAASRAASVSSQLLPFDAGWVAAHVRSRDEEWGRAALAQGVEIEPPPFPDELRPRLSNQQVFTQADVAELMQQHVAQRDLDWQCWCTDPHYRALHPNGPPAIGSTEFFQDTPDRSEQ